MDGSMAGMAAGHNRLNGRFTVGNTEYRARQQRLAERVRQLTLDYDPSPSQLELLPIIARHLDDALRGRSAERRVRAGNTADRLLRLIPKRKRPEAPLTTARELLERLSKGNSQL